MRSVNLYITFDDRNKIKKSFLNLRKYLIISVKEVVEKLGFADKPIDDCVSFIINQEILKMIKDGSNGRNLLGIVYSNEDLDNEIIREIIYYADELKNISKVVLLTDHNEHEDYYELFDEIMFYPSLKKVHIIECKSFPPAVDLSSKIDDFTIQQMRD